MTTEVRVLFGPRSATAGTLISLTALLAPVSVSGQGTGSVAGVVTLQLPAPRRSAARYPGGATQAHAVQKVPAVVFIHGVVAGSRPSRGGAVPVMAQQDTAFVPAALAIEVGGTVRFPNQDTFFHNVFSYSAPARFDLGRFPKGEAKDVTFDQPGIVKVYCEVHEFMRAVIVVAENPFHAVADEEGNYGIQGIPPGTYTLEFWHPDLEPQELSVQITEGATTRLDVTLR